MTKLREASLRNPELKDAFAASMYPVKTLLANRFKSMKLKKIMCSVPLQRQEKGFRIFLQ